MVGVDEAEAAVCVRLQMHNVGIGDNGSVQRAPVIAAWAMRADHDCEVGAWGDAQLSRGVELAEEVVDVREIHAH